MSFDFKILDGDFVLGSNGDLERVENTEKLVQDILKICITPLGSNVFFPWYGSPIGKSLIGNALDMEFMSTMASSQLTSALEALQANQQEQAKGQRVTPFEHMAAISQVRIERNDIDPRYFSVLVRVLTRALTEASTEFTVKPIQGSL